MPSSQTRREVIAAENAGDGALAATEAFSLEEAQRQRKVMVAPLPEDYKEDFREYAQEWRGVAGGGRDIESVLLSSAVNPKGLELDTQARASLIDLISTHDEHLGAMAELSYVLASDAMEHYFDSLAGDGWQPAEAEERVRGKTKPKGRWNRSLVLESNGYRRRIRFDSADYQFLEDHFIAIEELRRARTRAVIEFIAEHGR